MLPVVEVKLDLAIVTPLLEMIRRQAAALGEAGAPAGESMEAGAQRDLSLREVRQLLALFERPDFPESGEIVLRQHLARSIVRASSFLRLDMRRTALAGFSDQTMESGLNLDVKMGSEHPVVTCYLFLAALQDTALKHFDLQPSLVTVGWRAIRTLAAWLRDRFGASSGPWQVVVLNDPVNLMAYVTIVLRSVLGLSSSVAEKCMKEVHEAKRSIVWTGSREMAEAHARALRSWHLTAEARPADGR